MGKLGANLKSSSKATMLVELSLSVALHSQPENEIKDAWRTDKYKERRTGSWKVKTGRDRERGAERAPQ